METIQQQLNALQTSVKRQRLLNVALLGIIAAGGFIAAVRYDDRPPLLKMRCQELQIVDNAGNEHIRLASSADGGADIQLFDKNGKTKLLAETKADGSTDIKMFDRDGNIKLFEGVKIDGTVVNTTNIGDESKRRDAYPLKPAPDVKSENPPLVKP